MVVYGLSEGDVEERERFWNALGNGYELCLLEDLNGWVGDRMRVDITGVLIVPGYNGRRVINERGLCVSNRYFEHKSLRKYNRVARGQDGVKAMNIIDLVLVKKDILSYMQDVRAVTGVG